jgi:hypothetical protein
MVCSPSPSLVDVSNTVIGVERENSSRLVPTDSLLGFVTTTVHEERADGNHSRCRNGHGSPDLNLVSLPRWVNSPLISAKLVALIDEALSLTWNFDDSRS